jgi:S-DNA-T family DNA segregation ATPase FtsK/SpoIIIE
MVESALLPTHAGGILGMWTGNGLVSIVDRLGATLILLAIFFHGYYVVNRFILVKIDGYIGLSYITLVTGGGKFYH